LFKTSTLQDSSLKYELRDLISEDSRTKTYHAWDNELSRLVICVCLKKRVGEKGAREFLLHVRMLGQLKHPGLLPIHDMGVLKDSYFYCYRPAPGKTLYAIMRGESKEHQLETKSKQLMLILSQVADTVAYLHEQGVTIGKLDLETVSIGRYGEVIITDWTKSKKNDPTKEREQLNTRIRDDLKLLSSFGLSLWFLSPKFSQLTIREWDSVARDLPLELQIVFDRAQLGRGGSYRSAREFQVDINNFFIGRAPVSESNDIGFYLKGKFHSHRKAFLFSFALFIGCAITLLLQMAPFTRLEDELIELNTKQQLETVELEPLAEELKTLKVSHQREVEEHQSFIEKLEKASNRTKDAIKESKLLKEQYKKQEKEHKSILERLDNLKSRSRVLIDSKENLIEKIADSKLKNPDTQIDVPKFSWVDLSELLQKDLSHKSKAANALKHYSDTLEHQDSWFYDYLNHTQVPEQLTQSIDFEYSERPLRISSDGQKALWIGQNSLFILKLINDPAYQVIHLEGGMRLLDVVFESNSNYIQALSDNERVYRINIANKTPGWSRPYPWPQPFKSLIPYSPSQNFQIRSFLYPTAYRSSRLVGIDENLPATFDAVEKEISEKVLSILTSKQGSIYRNEGNALYLELNGVHYLNLPQNLIQVDFAANDKTVNVLTNQYLEIFEPTPNNYTLSGNIDQNKNQLTSLAKWTFPQNLKPIYYTLTPNGSEAWIQFTDGKVYHWNLSEPKGIHKPLIKGRPLLANGEKLLTLQGKNLLYYQMSPKTSRDLFSTINNNEDNFIPEEELDFFGKSLGKTWYVDDDPYYLTITEGDIEVWHRIKRTKIAVIAHSPRPLSKITYSDEDKKIYAMDDRGELLRF
jgi:hypothetical protein